MNARLISAPSLSPEEQKNRLAEFFREYWGTQQINDYHTDTTFHVNHKKQYCDLRWSEKYIDVDYWCSREIHHKEWSKFLIAITTALHTPIPPYYLYFNVKGRRTTLRKRHRRTESKIGCFIYPYKEDPDGGWDYNVDCLMIYESDFEILAAGINKLYPRNREDKSFDYTSWNEFTLAECEKIISHWLIIARSNGEYASFIQYVIEWIQPLLHQYDSIMIEGNL